MNPQLRPGALVLRFRHAAQDAVSQAVASACEFDPAQNLYVFSDPRGGSTWLTEALASVPGTAVMWEPLHKKKVRTWDGVGLGWRHQLAEDAEWEQGRAVFERVFRGKELSHWSRGSSVRTYLTADRLLIKICRANALLPWLTRQFQFAYAPVLLVRHPFAVVASQMQWGAWERVRPGKNAGPYEPGSIQARYVDVLKSITTQEEHLVARWCLTTLQAIRHPRAGRDWIVVHYEDLLLDPRSGLERLFDRWGLSIPPAALESLGTASATTKEATFESGTRAQLTKWQREFTDEQVARMTAILDGFGVTEYDATPLPHQAS